VYGFARSSAVNFKSAQKRIICLAVCRLLFQLCKQRSTVTGVRIEVHPSYVTNTVRERKEVTIIRPILYRTIFETSLGYKCLIPLT